MVHSVSMYLVAWALMYAVEHVEVPGLVVVIHQIWELVGFLLSCILHTLSVQFESLVITMSHSSEHIFLALVDHCLLEWSFVLAKQRSAWSQVFIIFFWILACVFFDLIIRLRDRWFVAIWTLIHAVTLLRVLVLDWDKWSLYLHNTPWPVYCRFRCSVDWAICKLDRVVVVIFLLSVIRAQVNLWTPHLFLGSSWSSWNSHWV